MSSNISVIRRWKISLTDEIQIEAISPIRHDKRR